MTINRVTGLSGLDVDSLVQSLMKAENMKTDKMKQDIQLLEWKRDNYRDITNSLKSFKDTYFDVIKASQNFRSPTAFSAFTTTAQIAGVDTTAVTVTAGSGATTGTHTLSNITLAKKAKWESSSAVAAPLQGNAVNLANLTNGKSFNITLDGTTKTITLQRDYIADPDTTALAGELQTLINNAFGAGNIAVSTDGTTLTFGATGHTMTISNSTNTIVGDLGFTSGDKNVLDLSKQLNAAKFAQTLNFVGNKITFEINGTNFTFNDTDTLNDVINTVNSSAVGVTLSYSGLTNKFTLEADKEGAINNIATVSDVVGAGNFIDVLNLTNNVQAGTDAAFTLDGVATTRSTNEFVIDGVSYKLNSASAGPINITIGANPDELVEKIKGFVEKYNEVIGTINTELTEKRYRSYSPLTDDQKEEMKDSEIELWEEKAKSGLLRSDGILQKITSSMRSALYDAVAGVDIKLYDIGITTSSAYTDNGKLVIDEAKLKQAIQNNPDKVTQLFTKESQYSYEDTANRSNRYNEEGLGQRLYDIIQDNIRTTRDSMGNKGALLVKAGLKNDVTEFDNLIDDQIENENNKLDDLQDRLAEKENYYYQMFAAVESALQQMSTQSSWLSQQFGGSQS